VLQRIFGPKRDEVTGGWEKLPDEVLCNLFCLPHIVRMIKSRVMRWEGHVARMMAMRNAYRIMVGKHEGHKVY
jgi:hypothetical protein